MQRRKKQQAAATKPPRVTYREQSQIMKEIFGNGRILPQKVGRENPYGHS
jgi:hypothetical protein